MTAAGRSATSYLLAAAGVALVAWLTTSFLPQLGLASSALLFLLPVVLVASRGNIGPALAAAIGGAAAYNFFLIPPRFTFGIHGLENLVSVAVLVTVALVTSRLGTMLIARESEALARAKASDDLAALTAELSAGEPEGALSAGRDWLERRYGAAVLLKPEDLHDTRFSPLDLSAATWAMHNGDRTGHGTAIMRAADWSFIPLGPDKRQNSDLLALARPADGTTRSERELLLLHQLALLLGQASDRAGLARERRERERLEEGDRLRRAILASFAHDFRTPLTVITGQLEIMARDAPQADEALTAARRLHRTMEDLLGAARLENGTLTPRLESLDLVDAVDAAAAAVAMPATIILTRTIPGDLAFVRADPILLQQVLVNLLDNAARHAQTAIAITAKSDGNRVLLSICDDGPGIPEAQRREVFERFARLGDQDRHADGSGLGLAIVKGFSEAMGLAVAISDSPSGGACFTIELPVGGKANEPRTGD